MLMTPEEFEAQVTLRFPQLSRTDDEFLLHLLMEDLYRYAERQIAECRWEELDRVLRLLDEAYEGPQEDVRIENAIRVSFLEYFDFRGQEDRIRSLLGPRLLFLYEDQARYMLDLAKRATLIPPTEESGSG